MTFFFRLQGQGLPFMTAEEMQHEIVLWKDYAAGLTTVYSHSLQLVASRVDQALTKYAGRKLDYKQRLAKAEEDAVRPLTAPELRKLGTKQPFPCFKSIWIFFDWIYVLLHQIECYNFTNVPLSMEKG